jgi:hypothetical protein
MYFSYTPEEMEPVLQSIENLLIRTLLKRKLIPYRLFTLPPSQN